MSNATVYCKAPAGDVARLLGDLSQYEEVSDENDLYDDYASLVEIWEPTDAAALKRAEVTAEILTSHGIAVGISTNSDPEPYAPTVASSVAA